MEFFLISIIVVLLFFVLKSRLNNSTKKDEYKGINRRKLVDLLEESKSQGIVNVDELLEKVRDLNTKHVYNVNNKKKGTSFVKEPEQKEEILNADMEKNNFIGNKNYGKHSVSNAPAHQYALIDEKTLEQLDNDKNKVSTKPLDRLTLFKFLKFGCPCLIFVLFALIVGINWESYSIYIKALILGMGATYIYVFGACIYLGHISQRIGTIIIYISTIMFVLLGMYIGYANQSNTFKLSIELIFLVYTLYISLFFGFSSSVLKLRGFSYLLLFFLYAALISVCFIVTNDGGIRLELILVINLVIFIFSNYLFKKSVSIIKLVLRAINQIVGILAYVFVIGTLSQTSFLVCMLLLLIPVAFDAVSFIRDKQSDIYSSIFFIPLKLLAFTSLLNFNINQTLLSGLMLVLIVTYISTLPYIKKFSHMEKAMDLLRWTYTIFLSALISFSTALNLSDILPSFRIVIVICLFALLVIPEIIKKRTFILSITFIYLIVLITQIQISVFPLTDLQGLSLSIVWLSTIAFVLSIFFKSKISSTLLPLMEAGMIFSGVASLITMSAQTISINYFIITIITFAYSYINKIPLLRYAGYVVYLIFYYFISLYLKREGFFNFIFDNTVINELILLAPTIFFAFVWDLRKHYKRNYKPEIFALCIFGLCTYLFSLSNITNMLYTTYFTFIYFIYCLFRFKNHIFVYFIYVIANLLVIVTLSSISLNESSLLMLVSFLNLFFVLVGVIFTSNSKVLFYNVTEPIKVIFTKLNNLCFAILGLYSAFMFLILIESPKSGFNYSFTAICIIISLSLYLLNKRNKYVRYLVGFPILLGIWDVCISYSLNYQFYLFPVFLDLLCIFYLNYKLIAAMPVIVPNRNAFIKKVKLINYLLIQQRVEYTTYVVEFGILLAQSLYEPQGFNLEVGVFIGIIAAIFLLISIKRKVQSLIILAALIIAAEIVIRIYVVFAKYLPLWSYLVVSILIVFDLGMYILWKSERSKQN